MGFSRAASTGAPGSAPLSRDSGYAPIRDYAPIGDGRTTALVARDGSIDWLCLPDLDSGSVFGALLDADRGGAFRLAPVDTFAVDRRYAPGTNVLETTFTTAGGSVRVTDAMPLALDGLAPTRELVRQVDGVSGTVQLRWSVEPRFDYAGARTRVTTRMGVPVVTSGGTALAVLAFDAGKPQCRDDMISGEFSAHGGSRALIALSVADGDPLVFSPRREIERRLEKTIDYWRGWTATRHYHGPWSEAVLRSALALKLLIHASSGAIAAAATTSLPEQIGGLRNWDYRYSWIRDTSATLDALTRIGCPVEADAYLWWLMHASQLTQPRVNVLYRLNGRAEAPERELPLDGYRQSRPVRVGNAAAPQLQLDVYGHVMHTAWLHVAAGGQLPSGSGRRLAATADLVSTIWQEEDSGIWEVRGAPRHFTESKMMCWIALDRACRLAEAGYIPGSHASEWRRQADMIRRFVSDHCWSPTRQAYERYPGAEGVDASLLLPVLLGYGAREEHDRLALTVARIRTELGNGPLLRRYDGDDGLPGEEGAFLACSFWLVDALARLGQPRDAVELMEELVALSNDVGLFAEEIDPGSGAFLGNFPQGLVHLALINAAVSLQEVVAP
jgi:GH15 family glucan-1,4-alpha-glucosidase